jgi:hypothetical protein
MRRSRRSPPPPRTPEERDAARAERERRRAARRGEAVPPPAARRGQPVPPAAARRIETAARRRVPAPRPPARDWAEPDLELPPPATAAARGDIGPVAGRRARNTAIFSVLTGLSRVAGLAREIVARSYFGTSGAI